MGTITTTTAMNLLEAAEAILRLSPCNVDEQTHWRQAIRELRYHANAVRLEIAEEDPDDCLDFSKIPGQEPG